MQTTVVYECKIILVGLPSTGKRALIERLSQNTFGKQYKSNSRCPYNVTFHNIDNQKMEVQLWETMEMRFIDRIPDWFSRGADGVFLTFDICKEVSFEAMKKFHEILLDRRENMNEDVQFVLVGCKSDLESKREVTNDVALAFAQSYGMPYIETSAKTGTNCTEALDCLARQISIYMQKKHPYIHLKKENTQEKRTACF